MSSVRIISSFGVTECVDFKVNKDIDCLSHEVKEDFTELPLPETEVSE